MFKSLARLIIYTIISPNIRWLPGYQKLLLKYCSINSKVRSTDLLGRLVLLCFGHEYSKLSVGVRADMQSKLMGGITGVNWAKHYQSIFEGEFPPPKGASKIGALDFHDANPIFEKINDYLSEKKDACAVIQLGASSGKEIVYFAKNHPTHVFYYTDIYDSVVEYASSHHRYSNLHFLTAGAENLHIIASITNESSVLVFSSGSSQYIYPENLDLMLMRFSHIQGKEILFAMLEPGNDRTADPLTFDGSIPRGAFSYTHNYSYYANKHGFKQLEWRKISPYVPKGKYAHTQETIHLYGMFLKNKV